MLTVSERSAGTEVTTMRSTLQQNPSLTPKTAKGPDVKSSMSVWFSKCKIFRNKRQLRL